MSEPGRCNVYDQAPPGQGVPPPACPLGEAATSSDKSPGAADACMTVLYDGACPLCRREIGLYRDLPATAALQFEDVSNSGAVLPEGVTQDQLLARFHVRQADGSLLSGAPAFLAMWAVLPGWRWLAWIGRIPGAAWMMERAYRGFLRLRPRLQRWAVRLERPPADGSASG